MSGADAASQLKHQAKAVVESINVVNITCAQDTYTAGETLSGSVNFLVPEETQVRKVTVQVIGIDLGKGKTVYSSDEKVLLQSSPGSVAEVLKHDFQFEFLLPTDLAASVTPVFKKTPVALGAAGKVFSRKGVIYRVEAQVELDEGKTSARAMKKFNLKGSADSSVAQPKADDKDKKSKVKVTIPGKGLYYPGDSINIEVDVSGVDPVHIPKLRVSLVEATYAKLPKGGKWIGQETPLLQDYTLYKSSDGKYSATLNIPTTLRFGSAMSDSWDDNAALQPAHLIKVAAAKQKDPVMKIMEKVLGNKPPSGQVSVPIKVAGADGAKGDMANVAMGGLAAAMKL